EARGDTYTAYLDGQQTMSVALPLAPASGGIAIDLGDQRGLPSGPRPIGIDRVRVTDLVSGEVLFEDDFDEPPPSPGLVITGDGRRSEGFLHVGDVTRLSLPGMDW